MSAIDIEVEARFVGATLVGRPMAKWSQHLSNRYAAKSIEAVGVVAIVDFVSDFGSVLDHRKRQRYWEKRHERSELAVRSNRMAYFDA